MNYVDTFFFFKEVKIFSKLRKHFFATTVYRTYTRSTFILIHMLHRIINYKIFIFHNRVAPPKTRINMWRCVNRVEQYTRERFFKKTCIIYHRWRIMYSEHMKQTTFFFIFYLIICDVEIACIADSPERSGFCVDFSDTRHHELRKSVLFLF